MIGGAREAGVPDDGRKSLQFREFRSAHYTSFTQ